MDTQNSRSKKLLDKVYNQLDSIDLTKLSMSEMKDFLEVVQKGQFLESFGKVPPYGLGMCATSSNGHGTDSNATDTSEGTDKKE